tara:strand:+ start:58011 stop:59348 length:1338 start_codon:yes stop_codon:yes gene_type:complete
MPKYQPYQKYKDSGVEWLGEVPKKWLTIQSKRIFKHSTDKSLPNDEQLAATQMYGVIPQKMYMELKSQKVVLALNGTESFKHTEKDDFVISLRSFQGGIERSHYSGCVSPAYTVLKPTYQVNQDYFQYLFKSTSFINMLGSLSDSIREGKPINYATFSMFTLPLPSKDEQIEIASILKIETTRIDALIQKKTRFIELLKEKRQALISHAVTKGLDPKVAMKDSGIDWLGDVPTHWDVTKLKYVGQAIIGLTYNPSEVVDEGEGIIVLRSTNIQDKKIILNDVVNVTTEIPEKLLTREGDILICSRNGSKKLIGKNAIISKENVGLTFGAFTTVFRCKSSSYVYWLLNSQLFEYQSGMFSTTTINQLTTGTLNNFNVPFPTPSEQLVISNYLTEETGKIELLLNKTQQSIELLKEHRTALISAAVTGKIDVRNHAGSINNNKLEVA